MNTYFSKYSNRDKELNPIQREQLSRLNKLVVSYNEHMKIDVTKAKEKHQLKIRNIISDKTGLTLTNRSYDVNNIKFDNNNRSQISIQIIDHIPSSVLDLLKKYSDSIIELLLHYNSMQNSISELKFQLNNYYSFAETHKNVSSANELEKAIEHLTLLCKEVDSCGIFEDLNNIGPDILGGYFPEEGKVEIYWLGIGLCSILHNQSIEDFTIITLLHELTHGYTHIGFDKDGNSWKTVDYEKTDLHIVEGFAQFYTENICAEYFEGALNCFKKILPRQNSEYYLFSTWFNENESNRFEKARRMLLKTRNSSIRDYEKFLLLLEQARKSM